MPGATRSNMPRGTFPLLWSQGHLLAELPTGLALIDTGSPVSLAPPDALTEFVGTEFSRLTGMDELGERVLIDCIAQLVTFGGPRVEGRREALNLGPGGVPLLTVRVGNKVEKAILDTGAQLSYAPAHIVARGSAPERRRDFLPGFGTFETETAVLRVSIGRWTVPLRCGVLPPAVASMLRRMQLGSWIVGAEFFAGRAVQLDFADGCLRLAKHVTDSPAPTQSSACGVDDRIDGAVPLGGMRHAYEAAGSLLQAQLGAGDRELLGRLKPDDVVVVRGTYDHVEQVLAFIGIPHTVIAPADVTGLTLRPEQLLVVNCPGRLPPTAIPVVRDFVTRGGTLFTTDWALDHVLKDAFPGRLSRIVGRDTADDVVQVDGVHGTHPLLTDFSHPGSEPVWWLEGSSYPIKIEDPGGVEVLLSSSELEARYGSSVVAARFMHGAGEVIHMISHYYLQRAELRSQRHRRSGSAYARELGLEKVAERESEKFARVAVAEVEAAHKALRFMSNVVLEKQRRKSN